MTGRWGLFCIISMVSIVSGASGQVSTMAYWDFGLNVPGYTEQVLIDGIAGTPTLTLQYGEKDYSGKGGLEYTDQVVTYHAAGRAGAWDNVNSSSEFVITVNTTGWWGLTLRWDYLSENEGIGDDDKRGPVSFDMDYRAGETSNWVELLDNEPLTRDTTWHEFTQYLHNLGTIIEDEPFVQFRIYDLSRQDESGGVFKVDNIELTGNTYASSITVLSPNGGENLMAGEAYLVEWDWEALGTADSITLDFSINNGDNWFEIDTVAASREVYAWKVPEIPNVDYLNCLVRVSNAANAQVNDTSNATFRIFQCQLNYDLSGDCYIDLHDLALLASEWLQCGDVLDPRCL